MERASPAPAPSPTLTRAAPALTPQRAATAQTLQRAAPALTTQPAHQHQAAARSTIYLFRLHAHSPLLGGHRGLCSCPSLAEGGPASMPISHSRQAQVCRPEPSVCVTAGGTAPRHPPLGQSTPESRGSPCHTSHTGAHTPATPTCRMRAPAPAAQRHRVSEQACKANQRRGSPQSCTAAQQCSGQSRI